MNGTSRSLAVGAASLTFGLAGTPTGAHVADAAGCDPSGGGTIASYEVDQLGLAHAPEPAVGCGRGTRPTAARAAPGGLDHRALRRAEARPPAQVGRWTTPPFEIPTFAIHATVLPTGKVMFWGYPPPVSDPRPNVGQAFIWDPKKGTSKRSLTKVTAPKMDADGDGDREATPLYCSGESYLPDGRLLMVGGNLRWPNTQVGQDFNGLNVAYTFDPWSERYTLQGTMKQGRWYPSQLLIPDGRTLVLGGYNEFEPGGIFNTTFEVFNAPVDRYGTGTFTHMPSADRRTALYPHLALMPNGQALLAGPAQGDSAMLDTDSWQWSRLRAPTRNRVGGNMILHPSGPRGTSRVTQIGGYDPDEADALDDVAAVATGETLNLKTAAAKGWTVDREMWNVARSYANTLTLPDGTWLTVGGGAGKFGEPINYAVYRDGSNRHVELRDPKSGRWTLGPAQREDRAYHSSAVLLPDGRVWSAGDDWNRSKFSDTAEIYSPPYLFRGPRPQITSAPKAVRNGESVAIGARGPEPERAVLVAPGAITHGAEMNARNVEARIVKRGGARVTIQIPENPAVIPPGYYMLFMLTSDGVPSHARFIRVSQ